MSRLLKKLESTGVSEMCPSSSQKEEDKIDPKLLETLEELEMKEYVNKFTDARCLYSDLPLLLLTPDHLKLMVPEQKIRERLIEFIKNNFDTAVKEEDWELNPKQIFSDQEVVSRGTYGVISTGRMAIGTGDIEIAIKEIKVDGEKTTRETVINEVLVMKQLRHKNVVKCFGCFFEPSHEEDDDKSKSGDGPKKEVAKIILEYCPNGNLYDYFEKFDLAPIGKMELLIQIAQGLRHMHARGFVHRDLKPDNILLGSDGETVKLCDFGDSKNVNQISGTLCGTPEYLSPEQFFGTTNSNPTKIDIYSFGIIVWEVWSMKQPYETLHKKYKSNAFKIMSAIHNGKKNKRTTRPNLKDKTLLDCPSFLKDFMKSCWAENPKDRPESFSVIVEELQDYREELLEDATAGLDSD